ncbi:MAG: hypothetical protein IJB97_01590, partial [Clostridia bacterium]|nr:hypothetical protein [Clostridia bacterium]
EMIAAVVGECGEYVPDFKNGEKVKSPGVLYKHYSPRCQTALFATENVGAAVAFAKSALTAGKRVAALCEEGVLKNFDGLPVQALNLGNSEAEMANRLYGLLRTAETVCDVLVAVEPQKKDGIMTGVLNRLRKACVSTDVPH